MNKYIPEKAPWQAVFSNKVQSVDPELLAGDKKSFLQLVSGCNINEKNILNFFIKHHLRHNVVTYGQQQIANSVGLSRKTVNTILQSLRVRGLISYKSHQKQFTSNHYILSKKFFDYAQDLKISLFSLKAYLNKKISMSFSKKVTPYIDKVCNTYSNSIIIKGVARIAQNVVTSVKDFNKKVQDVVMETSPIKIPAPLARITDALSLNKWGQIRLIVYPEKALVVMFEELKKKNYIKAPFFWLLSALDAYCLRNKLHVDWDLLPILKKKYGMPDKPNYFLEKKISKPVAIQPQPDKIIVSPLIGLHKTPHPRWAMFIPDDLRILEPHV